MKNATSFTVVYRYNRGKTQQDAMTAEERAEDLTILAFI